jgi:hypothetical protein
MIREQFWRGNAALTLIVAPQSTCYLTEMVFVRELSITRLMGVMLWYRFECGRRVAI